MFIGKKMADLSKHMENKKNNMKNLRIWIEAQLKRGYTRSQIKGALVKKDYSPKAVAEVDKMAFQKEDKKKPGLAVLILLSAVIASAAFIYYSFQGSSSASLCDEFKKSSYKISCDEAVALALADKPGNIQNISIGTRRTPTESEGKILMKDTKLWLIDIRLDEPFYDEKLNKEIKLLRVGIGADTHWGIFRETIT